MHKCLLEPCSRAQEAWKSCGEAPSNVQTVLSESKVETNLAEFTELGTIEGGF